jgi:type IV pilus assembly protein PilM
MNKRYLLFIEIDLHEIRFLMEKRSLGKKSSELIYQNVPWPEGNALEDILRAYRRLFPEKKKIAAFLLIPFENSIIREYRLPWMPKRQRDSAVRYFLQHEIPYITEEFVWRYQVTGEKTGESISIQVTACRKETVRFYSQILLKTGYTLKGMEYSPWALGGIFCREAAAAAAATICLAKSGKDALQFTLYKGRIPQLIRKIQTAPEGYAGYKPAF